MARAPFPLHSVGFCVHPAYQGYDQHTNQDVWKEFLDVMDTWCDGAKKEEDTFAVGIRSTERKEAYSLLTLPQVLAKILTIQSLGGATSVAKYQNYRVLQ